MCIHCVCLCVDVCVSLTVSLCSPPCSVSSGCRHTHNKPRPPSPAPPRDSSERASERCFTKRTGKYAPPSFHSSLHPAGCRTQNKRTSSLLCLPSFCISICLSVFHPSLPTRHPLSRSPSLFSIVRQHGRHPSITVL